MFRSYKELAGGSAKETWAQVTYRHGKGLKLSKS